LAQYVPIVPWPLRNKPQQQDNAKDNARDDIDNAKDDAKDGDVDGDVLGSFSFIYIRLTNATAVEMILLPSPDVSDLPKHHKMQLNSLYGCSFLFCKY